MHHFHKSSPIPIPQKNKRDNSASRGSKNIRQMRKKKKIDDDLLVVAATQAATPSRTCRTPDNKRAEDEFNDLLFHLEI